MEKISLKINSLSEIICIFAIRVVEFAVIFLDTTLSKIHDLLRL